LNLGFRFGLRILAQARFFLARFESKLWLRCLPTARLDIRSFVGKDLDSAWFSSVEFIMLPGASDLKPAVFAPETAPGISIADHRFEFGLASVQQQSRLVFV
jgi:hypothetical protein